MNNKSIQAAPEAGMIINPYMPSYDDPGTLNSTVVIAYTALAIVIVVMLLIFIKRNLAKPKELFYCLIVVIIGVVALFYGTLLLGMFNFLQPRNAMCIQSISTSCFLNTTLCHSFPNPCATPPLWFSQTSIPTQPQNPYPVLY